MSVYVFSDIHGYGDIYQKIKNYVSPEDKIICLGDICDRGPDGFELFQKIYNDPQIEIIRGNHEQLLIDAIEEWLPEHIKDEKYDLLCWNGGQHTFSTWKNSPTRNKWYKNLCSLPYHKTYINPKGQKIFLSHAGFTPTMNFNFPEKLNVFEKFDLLWSRDHFNDAWTGAENTYIVHGHTTKHHMLKKQCNKVISTSPFIYADGHKIDIDCGIVRTSNCVLFNLDNFESIKFTA